MPYRLHPLWYSPLSLAFLISAIGLGMMMVMLESHTTAYLYRRKPEKEALQSLGGAARWVQLMYIALRFGDLAVRGQLRYLTAANWHAAMFWFEIAAMAVAPLILFSLPVRRSQRAVDSSLWGLRHRAEPNRCWRIGAPGARQSTLSPGVDGGCHQCRVVSAAALAFLFMVERFKVWEQRRRSEADPLKLPEFDKVGMTWLGVPAVAGRAVYSLAFVFAAAIGFALLAPQPPTSRGIEPQPAHRARGREILWIDGNLNGYGVAFPHDRIEKRLGGETSCVKCHHMNLPRDRDSGCWECHQDMYLTVDASRHDGTLRRRAAAWRAASVTTRASSGPPRTRSRAMTATRTSSQEAP
jgi:hypothetical protein